VGLMDEVRQENIGSEGKVNINVEEYKKVMKKYKKIKKYMKSSIFAVKTMDDTEKLVSNLLKEAEESQDDKT
tara:strand:+ start:29 stop:244 length:216 start_codon:yes stop_codon:yes gene_type:complete